MVHGPRRIMYMIQNGMEEEVLSNPDIWRCVSCYSCMNRCPRGIEITVLFSELRRLAIQKGYVEDNEAQFGQVFTVTAAQHGRMFEPELLTRYYLRTWDVKGMLGMIGPGLKMLLKGKVNFTPQNIAASQELRDAGVVPTVDDFPRRKFNDRIVSLMIAVLGFFAAIGRLFSGSKKEALHG